MSRFVEWLVCLYDGHAIVDYLDAQVTLWHQDARSGVSRPAQTISKTIQEIARGTGLSDWRIRLCLRRLSRRGLVERDGPDQWRTVLYL